jgi:hydrogenase expression/formation protein HypE
MSHGSGGIETAEIIESIFLKHFRNEYTTSEDAAVLPFSGGNLAFTTDSYVVQPLFFRGGDIGRLAVCGTVNDLLTTGGTPLYLSAAFILEENLDSEELDRICASMRAAADESDIRIVTGDTKVIEAKGGGGLYITTAGVARCGAALRGSSEGDAIIVSGTLGEHHACILSARMGIKNNIKSDAAPLTEMVGKLAASPVSLHALRDITRGGLATVLNELAGNANLRAEIDEQALPVSVEVGGLSKILGLDPLYMGSEGRMLVIVPASHAAQALEIIQASRYGENAAIIGRFTEGRGVAVRTALGGLRRVSALSGEGLPRIC